MKAPRIWLAPLRGVTLSPFRRRLFASFGGVHAAVAPFVPLGTGSSRLPRRAFSDVLADADSGRVVPQVIGRDPAALREAASVLRGLGFTRLNLNCGCPWKFVARKGRGSGLLEDRDAFGRMLEAGCEAMPGGFSVKVRLGYRSPDALAALVPVLNAFPLERVFVHPRTGVQMYGGRADEEAFARVFPLLSAPVVYNGDVFAPADAVRVAARFPGLDGIMVGRGLCARPDLAERIAAAFGEAPCPAPPPDAAARPARGRVADFAAALDEEYARILFGPAPLLGRLKELWGYLHESFETGCDGLRRIQRSRTPEELRAAVASLCGPCRSGRDLVECRP